MANNESAKKRIRTSERRRLRNRYKLIKARNLMKELLATTSKTDAQALLPKVVSSVDRLAKHNIIHLNNAARKKSRLVRFVNGLG